MRKRGKTFFLAVLICFASAGILRAQVGEAGVESPFSIGVGARALGMGSAGAAYPEDPTAFFWNPAGMVVVQQKGVLFSLTTLFEGTQYNFLGYVHPTLSAGSFGIGIYRIGTGGIQYIEDVRGVPVDMGELDYWWGKLTISYAYTLFYGISLGLNLNVNRQVLGFYSTNGFGLDGGFHYAFPVERGLLSNLYLGVNWTNLVQPRMKLGVTSERIPYLIRGGMAKLFFLRNGEDRWSWVADVEQGENKKIRYHFGTEYAWNNTVFVRLGWDYDEFSFGGGLRFKSMQLDYGTCRIGDPLFFPRSHRFSLSFYIGKSVSEQKEDIEARRQEEILNRISEQMEADRRKRIDEWLRAGQEYMDQADYFNARLAYRSILQEDPEHAEAIEKIREIEGVEQELQRRREEELLRQGSEEERVRRDNAYVDQRRREGIDALEKGEYQKAIEKWQDALERDPNNRQVQEYLNRAREELRSMIDQLFTRADRLRRQENYSEAYKVLDQAEDLTEGNEVLHGRVLQERRTLDRAVNFLTNYNAGVRLYGDRDYENATRYFEKALEYYPDHEKAKWYLQGSIARSRGKKLEMSDAVKRLYYQGMDLYIAGRYEEARQIWEQALEQDPHNLYILRAIDSVKEKIDAYRKEE
jgi:tetratricopeptide (TPR) repeat protein